MLREITGLGLRPVGEAGRRRWFQDDYFDLTVWFGAGDVPVGFQLSYDRKGAEHALTWKGQPDVQHDRVDSGEDEPDRNNTPILVAGGECPWQDVLERFERASAEIDPVISELVLGRLRVERHRASVSPT